MYGINVSTKFWRDNLGSRLCKDPGIFFLGRKGYVPDRAIMEYKIMLLALGTDPPRD